MNVDGEYWREDGSAATENILLVVNALGYGRCWIKAKASPNKEYLRQSLAVLDNKRVLLMIALDTCQMFSFFCQKGAFGGFTLKEIWRIVAVGFIEPNPLLVTDKVSVTNMSA